MPCTNFPYGMCDDSANTTPRCSASNSGIAGVAPGPAARAREDSWENRSRGRRPPCRGCSSVMRDRAAAWRSTGRSTEDSHAADGAEHDRQIPPRIRRLASKQIVIERRHACGGEAEREAVERQVLIEFAAVVRAFVVIVAADAATIEIAQARGIAMPAPRASPRRIDPRCRARLRARPSRARRSHRETQANTHAIALCGIICRTRPPDMLAEQHARIMPSTNPR